MSISTGKAENSGLSNFDHEERLGVMQAAFCTVIEPPLYRDSVITSVTSGC